MTGEPAPFAPGVVILDEHDELAEHPEDDDQTTPFDTNARAHGNEGQWKPTNGFAIASLILGLLGIWLLGIIFGWVALRQIRRHGRQTGRGMAIAGVILSLLWVVAAVVVVTLVLAGV